MQDIGLLIISLGIILIGAEAFTNGIEWLGQRLKLGAGAVGSIFAAVGTALPETMIPVMAILGGGVGPEGTEIGIGAILGAPFMLATVAFFITGLSALIFRRRNLPLRIDANIVNHDLKFFLIVYSVAILASFLPNQVLKNTAALALVLAYGIYVYQTICDCTGEVKHENLAPLYASRRTSQPTLTMILVQISLALVAIVFGADRFVDAVQPIAVAMGIPVFVLSLIITPIATELPEKFNSVLWIGKGKDTLAFGNLSGAMVFQSSVIPAIGIAPQTNATVLASVQIITVSFLSGLFSTLLPQPTLYFSSNAWIALLVTAVPATSLAFFVQTKMQQFTTPTHTALIFSMEPVFAAISAFFLAGEMLTSRGLFGAGLV